MKLIHQHKTAIQQLCLQHRVKRLYAFGSILTNEFDKKSDVDLIVDFEPIDLNLYADNYFNFKFALEDTLHRPIDLLEGKTIKNPFFKQAIEKQRQLIYGH